MTLNYIVSEYLLNLHFSDGELQISEGDYIDWLTSEGSNRENDMAEPKKTPKRAGRKPMSKEKLSVAICVTPWTRRWLENFRERAAVAVFENISDRSAAHMHLSMRRSMPLGLVIEEILARFDDPNSEIPPEA